MFGWDFGATYALAAFTLTITGCLPLALLATMNAGGTGAERAQALLSALPVMAGAIAILCAVAYFSVLRHRIAWQRHALMLMWGLSIAGLIGWWKL